MDKEQDRIMALSECKPNEIMTMTRNDKKKTFSQSLTELLDIRVAPEQMTELLGSINSPSIIDNPTLNDYLAATMIVKAAMGDNKAFEIVRDTIGQRPVENIHEDRTIRVLMDEKVQEYGE